MKTLDKLKEICEPHGVTFEHHIEGGDWYITFDAPPKMCWGSSTATVSCYNGGSLNGVIGYIKEELKSGFYKADNETLRITGQL